MTTKNLVCITCPLGCLLTVSLDNSEVVEVKGNICPRGATYAKKELTNPTRVVTTTVKVAKGKDVMVSVKTQYDIPKEKIKECIKELQDLVVTAPIGIGDIIKANIANTGVSVVATKNVAVRCEEKERC